MYVPVFETIVSTVSTIALHYLIMYLIYILKIVYRFITENES